MDRLPPRLDFLVIFNPTLTANQSDGANEDEDADEKAHILFHTCREQSVSRDRMLRQVGLAKALTNFSEMFGSLEGCDNAHSTKRRLVMVTPEQDYWIHASIDLARTPKTRDKGKETSLLGEIEYDYHDSSLNDSVLQTAILRGYDEFKLLHGTFESLLSQSKPNLERQLDIFFTLWSWKWDLENPVDFPLYLGTPIHSLNHLLSPLIDMFQAEQLPTTATPIVLSPPYIIGSCIRSTGCPTAIIPHLLSLFPPLGIPSPTGAKPIPSTQSVVTSYQYPSRGNAKAGNKIPPNGSATMNFIHGIPNVKKLAGFLSLSKSGPGRSWKSPNKANPPSAATSNGVLTAVPTLAKQVDRQGLENKVSTERIPQPSPSPPSLASSPIPLLSPAFNMLYSAFPSRMLSSTVRPPSTNLVPEEVVQSPSTVPSIITTSSEAAKPTLVVELAGPALSMPEIRIDTPSSTSNKGTVDSYEMPISTSGSEHSSSSTAEPPSEAGDSTRPPPGSIASSASDESSSSPPHPVFSSLNICLDPEPGLHGTELRREKVWYLTSSGLMFALFCPSTTPERNLLPPVPFDGGKLELKVIQLLEQIRETIDRTDANSTLTSSQSLTNFVVSGPSDLTTISGPEFISSSSWLFRGHIAVKHEDTLEQFSRTTTSQTWYISKRILRSPSPMASGSFLLQGSREIHLEIGRKESSLVDVDNDLAAVVRKHVG